MIAANSVFNFCAARANCLTEPEALVLVDVFGVLFVVGALGVLLFIVFSLEYCRTFKEREVGADLTEASKAKTVSKKRVVALKDISRDIRFLKEGWIGNKSFGLLANY